MNKTDVETGSLTPAEKTSYISGVLDGADIHPECRVLCKEYLADFVAEIESKQKAKDPFAIH